METERVAKKVESERLVMGWWLLLVFPAALVWLGLVLSRSWLGHLVSGIIAVPAIYCLSLWGFLRYGSKLRSRFSVVMILSFILALVGSVLVPNPVSAHEPVSDRNLAGVSCCAKSEGVQGVGLGLGRAVITVEACSVVRRSLVVVVMALCASVLVSAHDSTYTPRTVTTGGSVGVWWRGARGVVSAPPGRRRGHHRRQPTAVEVSATA